MGKMNCRAALGFSLAEAMVAVVIVGFAAAGALLPYTVGASARAEAVRRTLAAELASDLMEQIVVTDFDQLVAMYDGYVEPQGQIRDAEGQVLHDLRYAKFSREVSCQYVYVAQQSGFGEPDLVHVRVRVLYEGKELCVVDRLISRW